METLILIHSYLRYFVLIALVLVIVKSLIGWLQAKPYTNLDNKMSLYLFIFTHMQLLIGLILFFTSKWVKFSGDSMKDDELRYWLVEHSSMMLIAIVLITMARITSKRMVVDVAKHRRMVVFNLLALVIIVVAIWMSGRGVLVPSS